jgi:ribosomal protein S18 acetylase RimI-like enzyme
MGTGDGLHVSLRTVLPGDQQLLREIYASTRDAEMAVVPWDEATKRQFLDMQWRAQTRHFDTHNPAADYSIILRDGEPIGRLYVDRSAAHIQLLDIALLPSHRAQGIGTLLLNELMDEARRERRALRCHVEVFNRAWRLYERLGFRPIAEAGMYMELEWIPDAVVDSTRSAAAAGIT